MSTRRWLFASLSFATAIGVSLYIIVHSWPKHHAAVSMGVAAHGRTTVLIAHRRESGDLPHGR